MSIVKKMILSFSIIIAVILIVLLYSTYFTATVRDEQAYLLNHVMERNRLLVQLQNEFRGFWGLISLHFDDWGYINNITQESAVELHAELDAWVDKIVITVNDYETLILTDPVANEIFGFDMITQAIDNVRVILDSVLYMQEYYRFTTFDGSQRFASVLPNHAMQNIDSIENLRQINLDLIATVSYNLYNQQEEYFFFNLLALVLIMGVALTTVWLMTTSFKKRISLFATKAKLLQQGDFSVNIRDEIDDEIGQLNNLVGDIVDIFKDLVVKITKVSEKVSNGDAEARLEIADFKGDFQTAALAINDLAKDVMDTVEHKSEEDYYEYLQFMMDSVPLVITFWDKDFNLTNCNEEVKRRYGVDDTKTYLEEFFRFSPEYQPDGSLSSELGVFHMKNALEYGNTTFDWVHQDIDGNLIPSRISCYRTVIRGEVMICSYATDMRDFYRAVDEIKRSELAEETSEAKTRFLARMSHEIRTPISAVLGISEIQLKSTDLSLSVEEAFAKIYSSSQVLLSIVNDILDLSKIAANKMVILQESYESASLINDMIQLNVFRLGSKKIKFEIEIDPDIPLNMIGDELRIKQVLNNLLSNAFKYTQSGFVFLSVKFVSENAENSFLEFVVEDTGVGMSAENVKSLFEEFVRFDEKANQNIEGAGLGMAIVSNLLTLMDATIDVQSEVGKGTTFTVRIPQKRANESNLGVELADNLKTFKLSNRFSAKNMKFTPDPMPYGKVLVVDDVETNLFVAKGLLSFYDLEVTTVLSGYDAIDRVREGKIYDIIFLDHMMPGLDGIETIKAIHKMGYNEPIVALTANALIGQSDMFIQNGFDGFISKPIDTSHLNSILNRFIRDKQPAEVIATARKNAETISNERNSKEGMWEFFTGNNKPQVNNEFLKGLNKEFARTQKNTCANISAALAKEDFLSCRRFAHTLKGIARTLKMNDLANLSAELEDLFEKNPKEELEKINELLAILEQKLSDTIESLNLSQAELEEESEFDLELWDETQDENAENNENETSNSQNSKKSEYEIKMSELFCQDAEKAISVMQEFQANGDIKLFTITVHAMRSALHNIGESSEKIELAANLENAANNNDTAYITAHTMEFIEILQQIVTKLRPQDVQTNETAEIIETVEDTAYLSEKLAEIKQACEDYDDNLAYNLLDELDKISWKAETTAVLKNIRDALFLHSDFERAAELAEELKA
ncbi:MAG: ATP-binding protein [Firmicutes bacterium]|nr:ATP-binding protein [Bacillota bacterium]